MISKKSAQTSTKLRLSRLSVEVYNKKNEPNSKCKTRNSENEKREEGKLFIMPPHKRQIEKGDVLQVKTCSKSSFVFYQTVSGTLPSTATILYKNIMNFILLANKILSDISSKLY